MPIIVDKVATEVAVPILLILAAGLAVAVTCLACYIRPVLCFRGCGRHRQRNNNEQPRNNGEQQPLQEQDDRVDDNGHRGCWN